MPPSPQRNYLTSHLIKLPYTAVHYNGRLIYSVYFEFKSMAAVRAQNTAAKPHTQTRCKYRNTHKYRNPLKIAPTAIEMFPM